MTDNDTASSIRG